MKKREANPKARFLMQLDKVIPWQALIELNATDSPEGKRKQRLTLSLEILLRTHLFSRGLPCQTMT